MAARRTRCLCRRSRARPHARLRALRSAGTRRWRRDPSAYPTADPRRARAFAVGGRRRADPRAQQSADVAVLVRALVPRCAISRSTFRRRQRACLQLAIVVAAIGLVAGSRRCLARLGGAGCGAARRQRPAGPLAAGAAHAADRLRARACSAALAALVGSRRSGGFRERCRRRWTLRLDCTQTAALARPLATTLAVGALATTLVALAPGRGCLENEARHDVAPAPRRAACSICRCWCRRSAFLFGVAGALVALESTASLSASLWAHLLFVLPYVFLSLADPWRALDPRLARSARPRPPPWRVFARVKLPILLRPILIAARGRLRGQRRPYLPTLFAGDGRVAT